MQANGTGCTYLVSRITHWRNKLKCHRKTFSHITKRLYKHWRNIEHFALLWFFFVFASWNWLEYLFSRLNDTFDFFFQINWIGNFDFFSWNCTCSTTKACFKKLCRRIYHWIEIFSYSILFIYHSFLVDEGKVLNVPVIGLI